MEMTPAKKSKQKQQEAKNPAWEEFIRKTWPKAKAELEIGLQKTKKLLIQGEKEVARLTDQGMKRLKIVTLSSQRERAYHDLGKLAATVAKEDLAHHDEFAKKIADIKKIDEEIAAIEKQLHEA